MSRINLKAKLTFFLFVLVTYVLCIEKCTDLSHLENYVQLDTYLDVLTVASFDKMGIMQCAKACQLRTRCMSFNFDLVTGHCQLLDITGNQTVASDLINVPDSVHSEILSWPTKLAGNCEGHVCASTGVCQETVTSYSCRCSTPPAVVNANGTWSHGKSQWEEGEEAPYLCHIPYSPEGRRVCQADGSWTSVSCLLIINCSHVLSCNNSYGDGEYWIVFPTRNNARAKIYCHGMTSGSPSSFITLPGYNYVEFPSGCSMSYCGRTTFNKVKVSLSTLEAIQTDYTYASTNCSFGPLCRVFGCDAGAPETCGTIHIDLNGTGFTISPATDWRLFSGSGSIHVSRSKKDTLIQVQCNGSCSICTSYTDNIRFKARVAINEDDTPAEESAVHPMCI